ncbi:hypothetical protein [Salirhabdus salicampi]|uniref:hypothetical protein n=1 Tax=Salirhabdus salicampi TaxID=476102 RepID=UPI0020C3858A|nr:hypothetical protein [Salirhabdus salicampi]MCP8616164.1 hypothetical protein [Salirhabdus salicampi]
MGMPNIDDIEPKIDLDDEEVVNLLLSSIALEEISLSHIMNAEGEKLQKAIKGNCDWKDLMKVNDNVNDMLKTIVKKQILLQFKFDNVLDLVDKQKGKGKKY